MSTFLAMFVPFSARPSNETLILSLHRNLKTAFAGLEHQPLCSHIRELKQPRRRRQQKPHKFAYLTMKNSIFARFARAYFIF